ncbi:hypothetical protein Bbelb_391680 [Branchiostoma belcheri]|nr:hypothetical protein Bbelb_391680 [Branchiostoma belcheri]
MHVYITYVSALRKNENGPTAPCALTSRFSAPFMSALAITHHESLHHICQRPSERRKQAYGAMRAHARIVSTLRARRGKTSAVTCFHSPPTEQIPSVLFVLTTLLPRYLPTRDGLYDSYNKRDDYIALETRLEADSNGPGTGTRD